MSSHARPIRVGRSIQAELSQLLTRGGIKDPRVRDVGLISLTEVRVSPDLKHARVFVSIFASEEARQEAILGLTSAAGFLRREVGRSLGLKSFPELQFHLDDTMEQTSRIDALLRDAQAPDTGESKFGDEPD